MTRAVVLLRAVNLGPRNRIAMAAFRSLLERVGCSNVETYVQSGNAVVTTRRSASSLQAAVAAALRKDLDLAVDVLVRTAAELDAVVAGNPFAGADLSPTSLHAVFLDGPAPDEVPEVLPDRIVPGERVLYVAYAAGSQDSAAGKVLGRTGLPPATARNWRTVLALQELC